MTLVRFDTTIGANAINPEPELKTPEVTNDAPFGPAAFRQENPVVAAYNYLTKPSFDPDPDFILGAAFEDMEARQDEINFNPDAFIGVSSQDEFDYVLGRIRKEQKDRGILDAAGVPGILAQMTAGLLSPTILLPGGAIVQGVSRGATVAKTAVSTGAWAMAGASIDEGILYTTQETRTGKEVLLGIGTAGVLGGLLGSAAGALTKGQIAQFEADMAPGSNPGTIQPLMHPSPAGAQINPGGEQFEEAGGTLKVGLDKLFTKLSPGTRNLNQKNSKTLRWLQANLSTSGMYLEGNAQGVPSALGGEVYELAQQRYALLGEAKLANNAIYNQYAKETPRGERLNRKNFDEAVGRALERGGESEIAAVKEAAKAYREKLFLPLYEEMRAIGFPGFKPAGKNGIEPVEMEEAMSYFHRVLRQGIVHRDEEDFLQILEEHFTEKLTEKVTNKIERAEERFARQQQEIEDLSLDAEGADTLRADLEAQIARLPEEFDEEIRDLAEEIRELREAARMVSKDEAKAMREQAKELEKQNKEKLKPFRIAENKIKNRFRRLDATRAGYEKKQEQLAERMASIEDQQLATLDRAFNRARAFLDKLDETDPKFEQKVSRVTKQLMQAYRVFASTEARLDKLRDRPADFEQAADSDVVPTDKVSQLEARQAQREQALQDISDRLTELEDPANIGEVRAGIAEQLENLKKTTLSVNNKRAVRLQKLREDAARFTPEAQAKKVADLRRNLGGARADFIEDIQQRANITTRTDMDSPTFLPDGARLADNISVREQAKKIASDVHSRMIGEGDRVPALAMLAERGPELTRTLDIDPTRVWSNGRTYEDFLERDVEKVARRYLRTVGPDLELYKRFGTVNPLHKDSRLFQKIKEEYNEAKEAISKDDSLSPEKKERERQKITDDLQRAIRDTEAQIARLKHIRGVPTNPNSWAFRAGRSARNLNVLRLMGGVVISSLPDMGSTVMRHGFKGVFGSVFNPFVRDLKAMKISMREAKAAGQNWDLALAGRSAALYDIFDEVEHGTAPERGLQWATNNFGKVSLFDHYNMTMKTAAAAMINTRLMTSLEAVVKGKAKQKELTYLAANGINGNLAERMWKELTETPEGSDIVNGVMMPNTANWQNRDLARAYSAALGRQLNAEIITPGLESPLWADENMLGRLVFQFRSFTFSSTQKILIAGAQEARIGNGANVLQGISTMLAMGAVSYYLWSVVRGKQDEMQNAPPEKWLLEAITRSGVLGVLAEVQTFAENVPATQPYATLGTGRTSRSVFATPIERVAGPTAGLLFGDMERIITTGDVGAIRRTAPMQNVSYLAWLFDAAQEALK